MKPTQVTSRSVLIVTSASAADASRGDSGSPDTEPTFIDPDTSTASSVRFPDGSTVPNAA